MPNAMVHLLLTDGQPDHKQRPHLPGQLPPYLLLSTMPSGLAYSFGQSGSPVRALSPPSSCCTPSLLAGRAAREAEKPLALGMRCSATTKPSGWDRHSSHPKSKTQLHTSHREENYLYPSQNQDKMPLLYEGWRMAQLDSHNQKGRRARTQSPKCQIGEQSILSGGRGGGFNVLLLIYCPVLGRAPHEASQRDLDAEPQHSLPGRPEAFCFSRGTAAPLTSLLSLLLCCGHCHGGSGCIFKHPLFGLLIPRLRHLPASPLPKPMVVL